MGGGEFLILEEGSEGNPDPEKKVQGYLAECQHGFH